MSKNPALNASLAELAAIVKRLNEETDKLNSVINDFEKSLVEMNPGFGLWYLNPIRTTTSATPIARGTQFGFLKWEDEWRLWIRRGSFTKSGDEWVPSGLADWKMLRLVEGTREERAAAVSHFGSFLDAMKEEAKARLKILERVRNGER